MTLSEVQQMSDEELRVAVAKLAGWKLVGENDHIRPLHTQRFTHHKDGHDQAHEYTDWEGKGPHLRLEHPDGSRWFLCGCQNDNEILPNFPHDLNAVQGVKSLISDFNKYESKLWVVTGTIGWKEMVFATARQRCEALVLTLSVD